ncbi:hypothetical protein, partial [Micromonospora sp. CB01531]|uniref:hypothetical protein n=1 Tax=Micromonospora sp. CB01531 TaxID=1718947 RepID=UPI0018E94F5F
MPSDVTVAELAEKLSQLPMAGFVLLEQENPDLAAMARQHNMIVLHPQSSQWGPAIARLIGGNPVSDTGWVLIDAGDVRPVDESTVLGPGDLAGLYRHALRRSRPFAEVPRTGIRVPIATIRIPLPGVGPSDGALLHIVTDATSLESLPRREARHEFVLSPPPGSGTGSVEPGEARWPLRSSEGWVLINRDNRGEAVPLPQWRDELPREAVRQVIDQITTEVPRSTPDRVQAVAPSGWCLLDSTILSAPAQLANVVPGLTPTSVNWLNTLARQLVAHPGSGSRLLNQPGLAEVRQDIADRIADMITSQSRGGTLGDYAIRRALTMRGIPPPDVWTPDTAHREGLAAAVRNWDSTGASDFGDGYNVLLADVLGLPLRISSPAQHDGYLHAGTRNTSPDTPALHLWHTPNHYDAIGFSHARNTITPNTLVYETLTLNLNTERLEYTKPRPAGAPSADARRGRSHQGPASIWVQVMRLLMAQKGHIVTADVIKRETGTTNAQVQILSIRRRNLPKGTGWEVVGGAVSGWRLAHPDVGRISWGGLTVTSTDSLKYLDSHLKDLGPKEAGALRLLLGAEGRTVTENDFVRETGTKDAKHLTADLRRLLPPGWQIVKEGEGEGAGWRLVHPEVGPWISWGGLTLTHTDFLKPSQPDPNYRKPKHLGSKMAGALRLLLEAEGRTVTEEKIATVIRSKNPGALIRHVNDELAAIGILTALADVDEEAEPGWRLVVRGAGPLTWVGSSTGPGTVAGVQRGVGELPVLQGDALVGSGIGVARPVVADPVARFAGDVAAILDGAGSDPVARLVWLDWWLYGSAVEENSLDAFLDAHDAQVWVEGSYGAAAVAVTRLGPGSTAFMYSGEGNRLVVEALRNQEGTVFFIRLNDGVVQEAPTGQYEDFPVRVLLLGPDGRVSGSGFGSDVTLSEALLDPARSSRPGMRPTPAPPAPAPP